MLKAIIGWIRRAVATVGSLFSKLIRLTFNSEEPEEQHMKKHKHKETFAQGETADDRKREDNLFARMKEHHDLAKQEQAAATGEWNQFSHSSYRARMILGKAKEHWDSYESLNETYLKTLDTEGPDVAYTIFRQAMDALEKYVDRLDFAMDPRRLPMGHPLSNSYDPAIDGPDFRAAAAAG